MRYRRCAGQLFFMAALMLTTAARAQMTLPDLPKPTGAELFKQQCQTCHTLNPSDPPRQGPLLLGVFGRKPGSVAGFHYSPNFAKADFTWDESHLDAWLTDPQALIPGVIMPYRQKDPATRQAIIAFLKDQK
jgi:cytochrome c